MNRYELGEFLKKNARLNGRFELAHGGETNIYFDKYVILSKPEVFDATIVQLRNLIDENRVTFIVGCELGGAIFATAIQRTMPHLRIGFMRKERKEYGTKRIFEGRTCSEDKIVIVEDVVTTATSVKKTIAYFQEHQGIDCRIIQVVALIDRNLEGRENILKQLRPFGTYSFVYPMDELVE